MNPLNLNNQNLKQNNMDSKQLRIGNWVKCGGEISNVITITIERVHLQGNAILNRYDQIEGIPLTEDILVKSGFTCNDWIDKDNNIFYEIIIDDKVFGLGTQTDKRVDFYFMDLLYDKQANLNIQKTHIKYVHELQNIIFALLKKELTINL